MDTNNRQTRSTQQDASQYSRYNEKYARARKEGHDQNTAFGTSKNPEGFVATWKNSSHKWRWRAVLCLFLSLLLMMMQPTGNALYRSWNASNGEMMGLAVAVGGDEGDDAVELATISDLGDRGVDLQTAGISDSDYQSKLHFNENVDKAPSITWAKETATSGVYDVREGNGYLTDDFTVGEDPLYSDVNLKNENLGNLGAATWIGEDNPAQYTGDNYTAGYWYWALGYRLVNWVGIPTNSLLSPTRGVDTEGVELNDIPAPESYQSVEYDLEVTDSYENTDDHQEGGSFISVVGNGKNDDGNSPFLNSEVYAVWSLRQGYKIYTYDNPVVGNDSYEDNDFVTDGTWISEVDYSKASSYGEWADSNLAFELWVVNDNGELVRKTGDVVYASTFNSFGEFINPAGDSDPSADPWCKTSRFYYPKPGDTDYVDSGYTKSAAVVGVTPALYVKYDSNGGDGEGLTLLTSFDSSDEDLQIAGAVSMPTDSEIVPSKTSAHVGDKDRSEFKGWAFSQARANEKKVDAEEGDNLLNQLNDYLQTEEGSADAYLNGAVMGESGNYSLAKSITLYAVWGAAASVHNVTFQLADGYSSEVALDTADIPTGGYKISGGVAYSTLTPPSLVDIGTDNPVVGTKYEESLYDWSPGADTVASSENSNPITITLTPKLKTYTVNLAAADGSFGDGAVTQVKYVPYGTPYGAIKYSAGTGDDDGSYVYDESGTPITAALTGGSGSKGAYSDASGNTNTWTGKWTDAVTDGSSQITTEGGVATLGSGASDPAVVGTTTLTYTYDEGYNVLTFAKASAASNATAGADATVAASQAIDDLSLSYTTAYVPYSKWTYADIATASNWIVSGSAASAWPTFSSTGTIGDKYATTNDTYAGGGSYATWSGVPTGGTGALPADAYTFTATPTLREFDVTLTIAGTTGSYPTDSGGYVTMKSDGASAGSNQQSAVVGSVVYGNYADAAINSTVIGGVTPTVAAGYTTDGATWTNTIDNTTNAPGSVQVTTAGTFTMALAKKTFPVTVEVNGGTFNQLTPTNTETTESFTITGVPYNTPVSAIKYNASLAYDSNGTYSLASPALTAGTGRNTTGSQWSSAIFDANVAALASAAGTSGNQYYDGSTYAGAGIMANGVTLKYEFGRDDVTVNYMVVGGTWTSNNSNTITGTVPYGKTIDDGTTVNVIPNPTTSGTVTVADTNQYFNPSESGKAGTWDTTPTAGTTITSTGPVTYTYTLKTRNDLTVNYTIPTAYQSEVEFDSTASYSNITYDALLSGVATPPTAIKAKSGVDAGIVAKKYNLTGFAWDPSLATYVTSDLSYEAQITLKDYTVSYEITNGSWGSGVVSTDATTYHYGDTPSTGLAMATLATSGTHTAATDTVVPASGYEKTGGAWEGVWEMRVNNDGSTWGSWTTISGTPSAQTITGNTQFRLTLKRVVPVTFTHDGNTISSGFTDVGPTEYYAGDALAAPTVTDSSLTAASGYAKKDGAKSGHWTTEVPSTVPDSATSLTYTYALYPVYTATYYIANGEWDGTWHGGAISGTNALSEELFSTESVTPPPSKSKDSSVYNLALAWYEGANVTSGTAITPSGTLSTNADYTAYYGSNKTFTYKVNFYQESIASAQAGGDKVPSNYALYKTWESAAVAPGTKVGVTAAILAESGNAPTPTAAWTHNATLSAPTLTSDDFTVVVEGGDVEFNVYYDRNLFNLSYTYTYPDNDSANSAYSGIPTAPSASSVPYGAALTADTAASSYAAGVNYLTFDGWQYNSGSVPSTMPAEAVNLTGAWTRNAVTLKLTNEDSSGGTVSATTGTTDGITVSGSSDNLTIAGYKYGDTVTWPTSLATTAVSGGFFAGWKHSGNVIGTTLPTTIDNTNMTITDSSGLVAEFAATWSTGIKVQYKRDAAGIGTFTEQDSGFLQPDSSGYVTVPSFNTASNGNPTTAHANGYIFSGWEWTAGGTTHSNASVTDPAGDGTAGTTTNVPLTFTAVYEGTTHSITYDVNGGTQNTSNANAIDPSTANPTKKTGETIYLPTSSELTRTGCTLSGYSVKVGAAEATTVAPGDYTVPAGTTADYTDAITITALWTTKVTFVADAPTAAGLSDAGITGAISTANAANTVVALGSTVSIPVVGSTPIAQVSVADGYHFDGYTSDTTLSAALSKDSTSFVVPSASTDVFPSAGVTITAKWLIDSYTVNWTYASDTVYNDAELDSTTPATVNYGTTGSTVQGSTAPTLRGASSSSLNTAKYTAGSGGIDWYLVVGGNQTKVKLADVTFGTPFYYNGDGICDSSADGAVQFTWTHGDAVTFVAVPKITQYTIMVAVSNGTMTNPLDSTTGQTSVSYTQDYGTKLSTFLPTSETGHAFTKDAYAFTANSDYVQSSGTWSSADPFSNADAEVTGSTTYTYTFPTKKSYIVKFEIGEYADKTADGLGLSRTQEPTNPEIGATYNASNFPTLTWTGDLSAKYETALTWTLSGASVSSGTYADSMVTGNETDWPKTITFVGTPQTKTYTVRVTVEGGSFKSGVEGVTDNVKTMTTDAVYGKPLGTYLPEVAVTFDRNTSGNMATGHWERVGARGTAIDPATDTVQYTDATYVYVFDTMRTVTFRVNTVGDGGFANNNPAAADGYYTKTYYVSDGKKLLDIADPADATGAKIFAEEAALQAMYKLTAQGSSQGYEWNTTGWTGGATTAANYQPDLTTEATGIAFPDASATIGSDVTYTYDYAPKAVTVNFVQMFQDATGSGYSQVDTATEGMKHSATWTGSYSTDPVAISGWSGRLLDGTDTTLYGYKVVPVKATSDAEGNTTITEFMPTNFTSSDTYYLWYDRITVNYGYSYTNTAPSTANGGATPTGGALRWGASATLANPIDSTYAQSLNGWYTTSALATLAAAPGASYTFEPAYTYSNPPESVNVTLYGNWQTASYPVTFANASTDDPNDDTAQFELGGTRAASGASVTTSAITYGTAIGSANVPDVYVTSPDGTAWTKDKSDKYSFVGWQLYIGNSATPETSVEGVTLNDKGYIESGDLQNVVLRGPNYTFKPVFELNQITVNLVGGTHQTGLDGIGASDISGISGMDNITGLTTWTVDYGTTIRLPKESEWMAYRDSVTEANTLIDANANMLPFTEDQYSVRATTKLNNASAWVWDKDGTPTQWPSTTDSDGYYVLSATENATYVYQWTDLLYEVHYMNVGGSTSNINALDGKRTTKTLTWGDSVFGAKLSDASGDSDPTVLNKFGTYNSGDKSGTAMVLYPEWSGHTFLGWQQGTSEKAGKGTIVYPGNDITISAAYNETYSGNTGEIYLWALWQGETQNVTFRRNAGEATETTATQALEIDVATNLKAFNEMPGFARDGYTFNGWVKQANKDTAWASVADNAKWVDKAQYTVQENDSSENLNLYANWTANTYKVQFAYFDGTPMTVKDVTGSGSETEPYQQTLTYGQTANLKTQDGESTLVSLVNDDATHNPGSDVFAGWSYNGTTLADGAEVSNLTTENNGVITLTPVAAKSVKLTYEPNAGTETVSGMPSPLTASSLVIDNSSDAMNGYASFTLPTTEPTRTGYTFKGWKVPNAVDASKQALSDNIDAGTTIYLSGNYAAYLAYAQWEAQVATTYTIERQVQSAPGSTTYTVRSSETKNATSGTWVEIGAGNLAEYNTSLEGYTYMPGLSTTGTYVAANGSSKIILKYNVEGYTLSYAFTEGGLALAGDAAGSTPFGTGSTVQVTSASPLVTLLLPSAATLPEGYQIASGYGTLWNYDSAQNSLKTADGASLIAASTVNADGATQYKVVGDTTLTLPIEKQKFTVTFKVGENTLWSDGTDATTDKTMANIVYGTMLDPDSTSVGAAVKPVATEGYGFGGWKYQNASDATDPLNGTIVDPATTAIKGNVTFTASHYPSFTVTWSAGGHSASGFSNTPENQRLFTALPPTGYLWESDGSTTPVAGLQLEAADLDGANPKAEDGYTFDGWVVNGNTANKYMSLEALYEAVTPNNDYTIEAQWAKITQTVLFDPNVSGGGATGEIARALQGLSGEGKLLDGTDAKTPTAPAARAGYEFNSWQLGTGATAVQLAAGADFTFPMNPLGVTTTYVAQWDEAIIDIQSAVDPAGKGAITANRSTTGIRALSTEIEYTLKANPQPGYKFTGWTVNTDTDISGWFRSDITDKTNGDYGLLTIQPVDGAYEEATYTAHFAPDPYEVTFENSATAGEGTISVTYASGSSELVEYNKSVSTTAVTVTPNTPGYRFLGWTYEMWPETADENGVLHTATTPTSVTTPVLTEDLGTVPITGRTVFTAKYAKNPATLTYDKHAAAATGSIGSVTGKETGDTVVLPSSGFTWAGHSLLGWLTADKDADSNPLPASMTEAEFNASAYKAGTCGATYTLKGGDETLYAVYKAEAATLVYDNNATAVDGLAKASSKSVAINANEDATALTIAAVNWENGDTLATQPGYVTDDASATRIPGAAREFVGWSFDKNAVEGGSSRIFAAGETIPASYLPASSGGTATIYAIWKDKQFTVSLNANGGKLKEGATAPSTPLASGITYGDTVAIPELMYERTGHNFRYWLADDGKPTRVSDSSGSAATYKFIGTSDVTLTAQWYSTGTAEYKVTMQLMDEKGRALTSAAMGPYTVYDTPLSDGAYEDLSVVSSSPLATANTGDYFNFEGWYIYNTFTNAQKVGASAENPRAVEVSDIVKLYDGTTASLPTYWDGSNYTDAFNNGTTSSNLLTLYAKKALKAYDISFDPHIPDGSGYAATDVSPIADILLAKVSGETRVLSDTYSLPGYTFLGWLKTQPTGDGTTTASAWAANADKVAAVHDLATPLLAANSTDYKVKLYAAWADTDNTVTFVSAYPGDGVIASDAEVAETVLAKQEHKTWKAALDAVTNPETHASNEFANFTGWYTANGVPITLGNGTGQCATVADIVDADPLIAASADGSYDIKLYAQYAFNSARVVYNGDEGAIAPETLPQNQAVTIPDSGTTLPAATITPHKASATLYKKAGYHMDGWEGRDNEGTYNGTSVDGGYYNKVILDSTAETDRAINFDYDAAGMVVNLYPHFAANSYTVNYSYDVPSGYSSYVMSAAVPGKDGSDNNVTSVTGLGLTTGSVYARNLFATDPVLEGYELAGWTYTTPGNREVTVEKGWTVDDLLTAAATADGVDYATVEALYKDSSFDLKAKWQPKTFSVAYDADGGILISTGAAPGAKTGVAWNATVDSVGDRLLIEASKLSKDGYSKPAWYVDAAKTKAANSSDGGDTPTFGQLVYLWHQANNHAAGTNVFDGSQPLTLHAGWTEDTVNMFFTVSDAENGWISSVAVEGGATTSYSANAVTQLPFVVGAKTGKVTVGGVDTTIDKVTVTAAAATGYSVSGWTFGADTVAPTAQYAVPAASRYVGGSYEAQIGGDPNVEIALRYFDMDNTGAYPSVPSDTSSGLKANDFLNADGGVAKVGDVIPAANLGVVRTDTPKGLSLDTGALADYTVKASDNTVDLYFERASVDVDFKWEWPESGAAATPPELPESYLSVYYGSTQNTPVAPTAPAGYVFDGWYKQGGDTQLGTTFEVDSVEGMTIVGKFSKASYAVSFDGVYDDAGTTKMAGEGVPSMDPATGITAQVDYNSTLGTSKKILLTDTAQAVKDISLGMQTGPADLTVSYDSSKYAISWIYSKDGGTTWLTTSDPTSVKIEGATTFKAVASGAQVVSYVAGDHGAFVTSVDAGTRFVNVATPYNMADYLYAGPLGADGLPKGEPGWRFAGWKWEYALPSGYMQTGATPELADDATASEKMRAGVEDLVGLEHGITLTAQWEPAESYLKFDLNYAEVVYDDVVRASWASGYTPPEGLQPTYDEANDNAVTLPDADQVTRNGFTLKGWKWKVGSTTYELAPGASFQMPASDKATADDPAVTLTAKWEEDYVTINYYSNDNAKGTVSVSSETIGTWTGKVRGGSATISGSKPTANTHFNFTKWTRGSLDGVVMTNATGLQTDNTLVPQRNTTDKRYDAADYYATFIGDMYYVTFKVDDASTSMGTVTVSGFSAESGQQVPYSGSPVMSGTDALGNTVSVVAKPNSASYDFADGRYWDYYVNTGTTASPVWTKKGSTTDPSTVKITAETQFRVNFKESTGTYPVHFDMRGGIGSFDDVYKAWGDANVGAGKTPRRYGYSFTGWFATPYGQTYASANDAAPGMMAAVSSTYGQLAGGDAYAAKAAEEGITLLAGWRELGGYAITLNGNGGTFDGSQTTAQVPNLKWTSTVSSRIPSTSEPARPGYDFSGWSTTPNGAKIDDGATYASLAGNNDAAPGSVVLYALWTEKTYTVRYMNWPRSNDDPITEDGALTFDRELKYTDVVATSEPYNSKSDDRVWNAWQVITGSATEPNVELKDTRASWTIQNLESNGVEGTGTADDPFIVYATWTNYIPWTTTYVLYDDVYDNPGLSDNQDAPGDNFADPRIPQYLTITDKGLPGQEAVPNMVGNIPPGFELNEAMTVKYNNNVYGTSYATTSDMKAPLTASTAPGSINFDVVVVAKTGYSLAFNLNDDNIAFPGGYAHEAVPSADAGSNQYPTQVVKDFYKIHNVPWSVFATDNTDEGEALGNPTREGFSFDGWYNLVVKDNEEVNPAIDIKSDADMYYGDLAFDANGQWYDPMVTNAGVLTLYARWIELTRTVHYIVADDMKNLVKIRLQSEEDSAYSLAERTETIGSATGDVFVGGARSANTPQGAIAKANRGYSIVWRIVPDDTAALSKTYTMPLGQGSASSLSTASTVVSDMTTMAIAMSNEVTPPINDLPYEAASTRGAPEDVDGEWYDDEDGMLSVQAATGNNDTATSSEGKVYQATEAITPGVDASSGLFVGSAAGTDADPSAMGVLYVATAQQNSNQTITFKPTGADTYTGPKTLTQPSGTYVGETASGGVWGVNDGSLPDRNTIRRVGYTFNGWKSPSALTYMDENGNVQEIPANTVIVPGSWIANHLIVPASGLTLEPDWSQGAQPWAIIVPDSVNPNTGEVVPGTTFEVPEGTTLTNDQIAEILNRGGQYPDKWTVSYYDVNGTKQTKTMTTDELIAFLQKNPVVSDMTIAPAQGAKWGSTAPTIPDNNSAGTKGASSSSKLSKTGDSLLTMVPTIAGIAFLAAAVVFLLLSFRRRREE